MGPLLVKFVRFYLLSGAMAMDFGKLILFKDSLVRKNYRCITSGAMLQ
jgi:hypothetical protein